MAVVNLKSLILGTNYMPLSVLPLYTIPAEDAFVRCYLGKAISIYQYDRKILTPNHEDWYWPSVIVSTVSTSMEKDVRLKKSNLFYRDRCRCIFCGEHLTLNTMTVEHLIPRSKGGKHVWDNVGTACKACNAAKGNQLPTGKWRPKTPAYKPTYHQLVEARKKLPVVIYDERWAEFLPNWAGEIILKKPKLLAGAE